MSNPHPRNPPAWLAKAQIMRADNYSIRGIAQTLKAGHQAVRTWLERFPPGTPIPESKVRPTAEWEASARQMRIDGNSWEAIEREIGVCAYTIRMVIDPVFIARTLKKQKSQREFRLNPRPERRQCEAGAEKPKASAVRELRAKRFYKVDWDAGDTADVG